MKWPWTKEAPIPIAENLPGVTANVHTVFDAFPGYNPEILDSVRFLGPLEGTRNIFTLGIPESAYAADFKGQRDTRAFYLKVTSAGISFAVPSSPTADTPNVKPSYHMFYITDAATVRYQELQATSLEAAFRRTPKTVEPLPQPSSESTSVSAIPSPRDLSHFVVGLLREATSYPPTTLPAETVHLLSEKLAIPQVTNGRRRVYVQDGINHNLLPKASERPKLKSVTLTTVDNRQVPINLAYLRSHFTNIESIVDSNYSRDGSLHAYDANGNIAFFFKIRGNTVYAILPDVENGHDNYFKISLGTMNAQERHFMSMLQAKLLSAARKMKQFSMQEQMSISVYLQMLIHSDRRIRYLLSQEQEEPILRRA